MASRPRPQSASSPSRDGLAVAALTAATIACGISALPNGFILDDLEAIVHNPNITTLTPIARALSSPPQSAVAGRPLVSLTLALNYAFGGLHPAGYHAINLLLHLACGLLLFAIVRRTLARLTIGEWASLAVGRDRALGETTLAGLIALLWLVHPLQTEVVDYVLQRSESMMALCLLLTLYATIRAAEAKTSLPWTIVAVVACAGGMACKESMVVAPLIVLAYDTAFIAGAPGRAVRARPWLYAGLAATWVALVWLNAGGPRSGSAGLSAGVSPWNYLLAQGEMIVTYLKLTIWPHPLVLDYGRVQTVSVAHAAPFLASVGMLVVLALIAAWRWPRAGFLGLWFFVTLAPASSIVPIATEVGAERRMYLPLAALIALAVLGIAHAMSRMFASSRANGVRLAMAGAATIAVLCGVLTTRRNLEYRDPVRLWQRVIEVRPHGRAHFALAVAFKDRGDRDRAIAEFQRAAAADEHEAHYALGHEWVDRGRPADAIEEFRQFVRLSPNHGEVPAAYALMGRAFYDLHRYNDSAEAYRMGLTMRPRDREMRAGLGDALLAANRFTDAVAALQGFIELAPADAAGYANLGRALIGAERPAEAARAFQRATQLSPADTVLAVDYAQSLASSGQLEAAVTVLRGVLARSPDDVQALDVLGIVLAAQGRREEAAAQFARALRLDPGNAQVRADARAALGP